tara:strand:- start:3 stop:170 length:168 start_codon:yes stop_codon:yes gene_type:complete
MIQKFLITFLVIMIFLFSIRFLKKITSFNKSKKPNEEDVVDLEKDPETNEYKPKE